MNSATISNQPEVKHSYKLGFDRVLTIAAYTFLAVTVCLDLAIPKVSFAVLFSVPMLLLASRSTGPRHFWIHLLIVVVVIYGSYYAKYRIVSGDEQIALTSFRLFNRTFSAISLAVLCGVIKSWRSWQRERHFLDPHEQVEEDEVNSTAAPILCIAIGGIITLIDSLVPARFNVPILFIVPIYISSWAGNYKVLWLTAGALVFATIVGFFVGPAINLADASPANLLVNRTIVVAAILIMTGFLHFEMYRKKHRSASEPH